MLNLGSVIKQLKCFSILFLKYQPFYFKPRLAAFPVIKDQKYRDTVNLLSCPAW